MIVQSFFARQPIFDREGRPQAFEVLYRPAADAEHADVFDGIAATRSVLSNAMWSKPGADPLADLLAFVNLPRRFIVDRVLFGFPSDRVGAEILEDVTIDAAVIRSVRELRSVGYRIALDDFTIFDHRVGLLPYVDIVKVDIGVLWPDEVIETLDLLRRYDVSLLAEKVETAEDMERCLDLGFELFQGYYLARPEVIAGEGSIGVAVAAS